jgi:hypothetical protein
MKKTVLFIVVLLMAVGTLSAQNNVVVIDGNKRFLEDVAKDILMDWKIYDGKNISIRNVTFIHFGVDPNSSAYRPYYVTPRATKDWLDDSDTIILQECPLSYTRMNAKLLFWFQPANRVAKEFVFDLLDMYYKSPKTVTINGIYRRIVDRSLAYNPIFVSSFIIDGVEYTGIMP